MAFKAQAFYLIRRWFVIALVIYLLIVILMWVFQRSLIYHPKKSANISIQQQGFPHGTLEDVQYETQDGLVMKGWHALPQSNNQAATEIENDSVPVILYFSGNAQNRERRIYVVHLLSTLPAHVYIFDYRGYAENPGSPSQSNFVQDARSAWDHLVEKEKISSDRIFIFGESLGGGVSSQLAAELSREKIRPAGIVLKSTFSSLVDAASYHYPWLPVRLVLADRFESAKAIQDIDFPVLVIHGHKDKIVPFRFGQKLFEAVPEKSKDGIEKTFVELPKAGHNNVLATSEKEFMESLRQFMFKQKESLN